MKTYISILLRRKFRAGFIGNPGSERRYLALEGAVLFVLQALIDNFITWLVTGGLRHYHGGFGRLDRTCKRTKFLRAWYLLLDSHLYSEVRIFCSSGG